MEVTILKGQKSARDPNGNIYPIDALMVKRDEGIMTYYTFKDKFYRLVLAVGTTHQATLLPSRSLLIR